MPIYIRLSSILHLDKTIHTMTGLRSSSVNQLITIGENDFTRPNIHFIDMVVEAQTPAELRLVLFLC